MGVLWYGCAGHSDHFGFDDVDDLGAILRDSPFHHLVVWLIRLLKREIEVHENIVRISSQKKYVRTIIVRIARKCPPSQSSVFGRFGAAVGIDLKEDFAGEPLHAPM